MAKDPSEEAIKNFSAAFNTGIKAKRERFYTAIEKLIAFQNNEGKTWSDLADQNARQSNFITIVSVILGVALAIILAFAISANLSKVLRGLSLNLAEGSQALAETSTEIAHSSESLSSSVQEQAAAIQETSASAEELTHEQGKGFAVVAEEVGNLATMSGNAAQDISNMLGDSTAKVQEIVRQTKEEMSRLTTQSKNDVENGIKVANEAALASKNLSQQAMSLNTISQTLKFTIEGQQTT